MPVSPTYPGVYIEEISSGVRTITGVATSITAFIGRAQRGPTNEAIIINSLSDFDRIFGGLWLESTLGYAVRDFYLNGGSQAIIVRLFHPLFTEAERGTVEAAANDVASAAKTAAAGAPANEAGKKAKEKVDEIRKEILNPPAGIIKTPAERQADIAAITVADLISKLANNATVEDVTKVAESAVKKAASFSSAKLAVGDIKLVAAYEGSWGANLRATVDLDNIPDSDANLFNLTVTDTAPNGSSERFLNLSIDNGSSRRVDKVLGTFDGKVPGESKLVKWDATWSPNNLPDLAGIKKAIKDLASAEKDLGTKPTDTEKQKAVKTAQDTLWPLTLDLVTKAERECARAKAAREAAENSGDPVPVDQNGNKLDEIAKKEVDLAKKKLSDSVSDGSDLTINDFLPPQSKINKKGMHALEQADLFNLLCIPPYRDLVNGGDVDKNLLAAADAYCTERRALLLVDPHSRWISKKEARDDFRKAVDSYPGIPSKNAALFFPRLKQPNPLRDNQVEEFVPCGAVAGVFARTDTQRGVWKAPAGLEATLAGVPQLSVNLTDAENGELNPLGINCLRAFPVIGRIVWGSRTLRGADQLADEWKYIPVRRTALFIEESLYRGTQWAVFEPNDEPLWAQLRLNIGAFMNNLFRQGAFQGRTTREAYLVKCDSETTTQNDINLGIVNVVVGFAPLKPAEFVVIKIQQLAGQIQV
jgi:phage tail sheath protein FI